MAQLSPQPGTRAWLCKRPLVHRGWRGVCEVPRAWGGVYMNPKRVSTTWATAWPCCGPVQRWPTASSLLPPSSAQAARLPAWQAFRPALEPSCHPLPSKLASSGSCPCQAQTLGLHHRPMCWLVAWARPCSGIHLPEGQADGRSPTPPVPRLPTGAWVGAGKLAIRRKAGLRQGWGWSCPEGRRDRWYTARAGGVLGHSDRPGVPARAAAQRSSGAGGGWGGDGV